MNFSFKHAELFLFSVRCDRALQLHTYILILHLVTDTTLKQYVIYLTVIKKSNHMFVYLIFYL